LARRVEIQIVGDDRSLKRALGSATEGSHRLGGAFRTAAGFAAGLGAILAGEKVLEWGKDAVESAAQIQKATENIRTQFGGASDSVIKFGEDAAKQFGISEQASLGFSSQMGIVAKNLGLGHDQAATMTIGLQKLSGSIGLIKGQDPTGFFDKLTQALLGNTRGLKQMGIAITPVQIKNEAWREGIRKSTSDLSGAEKATIIYNIATRHLAEFQDEARKHTGDFADQVIILKARLADLGDKIGQKVLPVVSSLVGDISKIAAAPNVTVGVGIAVHGVADAAKSIIGGIEHALEGSSKTVKIKAPSGLIVGEKQDMSKGIVQNIQDGLEHANWTKIGQTVGSSIGKAIHFSKDAMDNIVVGLIAGVNAHRGDIARAGLLIGVSIFTNLTDPSFWVSNWQVVVPALISGVLLALGPESKLAVFLKDIPFLGPMFKALEGVGSLIIKAMGPVGRGILRGIEEVFPGVAKDGEEVGARLLSPLRGLPGKVGGVFEDIGAAIGQRLAFAVREVGQDGLKIGGRLLDALDSFVGKVGEVATRLVGRIIQPFESLASRISGPVLRAGRTVVDAIGGVISRARSTAIQVGRAIMQGISGGLDSLKNWLLGKIEGIAGSLLNKAKSILHIGSPSKRFAEEVGKPIAQGIAMGITKGGRHVDTALASVLGMPKAQAHAHGGGGPDVIQLLLDGKVFVEWLRGEDKRYRRQNGGRPLISGA